jgi:16S rRNA (guanine(966)-N(2))-methyltransferase RsmD
VSREGVYLTGGSAKGSKLFSVTGKDVRPATSRLRISLFEILKGEMGGATVVDLFAGTGSLGLEALSRGAAFATFFDTDERSISVLRKNLEKLRFTDRASLYRTSAFQAHNLLESGVDFVFIDPPYPFYREKAEEMEALGRTWAEGDLLSVEGTLLVEHPPRMGWGSSPPGLRRVDERTYGGTILSFYRRA